MADTLSGLTAYFEEISRLLERQYGVANQSYTDYFLERLEIALSTCSGLLYHIRQRDLNGLEEYQSSLRELIECIMVIYKKWEEYIGVLESGTSSVAYTTPTSSSSGPGRPRFQITKDQLEYLCSLGFKWNEIAALIGVSRMTIYR